MSHMNEKSYGPVFPCVVLAAVCFICLAPFSNKAFHIDDTVFIWVARHIQFHPFDFYGFMANWNGTVTAMSDIQKNPPLASYYISLAAYLFGWSESAMHAAFLLPALAAAIGMYCLARELCVRPLEAALAGIVTPAFSLSASSLMCDTMMLSFWVWAVFFWVRGLKAQRASFLGFSALLVTASSLTKYSGMSLVPLLLVYSLVSKRGAGRWILFLSLPVILLAAYEWMTYALYGKGLIPEAMSYAIGQQSFSGGDRTVRALTGLEFTGGCLITTFFYAPLLWRRGILAAAALLAILTMLCLPALHLLKAFPLFSAHGEKWPFVIQFTLFAFAGINVLALAAAELQREKSAESVLLFLWICGTFIFGSFLNWSVNARIFLPMVPAAGILVMRRISGRTPSHSSKDFLHILPLVPALLLALWLNWSDYSLADSARRATAEIRQRYGNHEGTLWFLGHWGFQYYMEAIGAKAIDFEKSTLVPGDRLVVPLNNTNIYSIKSDNSLGIIDELRYPSGRGLSTMDSSLGAGFYTDLWGPLPFAFGKTADERYEIFLVLEKIQMPQAAQREAPASSRNEPAARSLKTE